MSNPKIVMSTTKIAKTKKEFSKNQFIAKNA